MTTWTVTVEDLDIRRFYTVRVETATNRQAGARVRALDTAYALPGLTWQSNLIVTSCVRMRMHSGKAA